MIEGHVDEARRALITIHIGGRKPSDRKSVMAWIDTAFNGGLVISRADIARLGLRKSSVSQAILADGKVVTIELFSCYLEWFGETYRTQAVANDGDTALLGTLLLANHRLMIDYPAKTLTLE